MHAPSLFLELCSQEIRCFMWSIKRKSIEKVKFENRKVRILEATLICQSLANLVRLFAQYYMTSHGSPFSFSVVCGPVSYVEMKIFCQQNLISELEKTKIMSSKPD